MYLVVNEALGEVELKSRLDESTYVLAFTPNNMAAIEITLNKDFGEITQDLSKMSVRVLRTIVRLTSVLPKNAKPMTDTHAGEILNAVGYKPVIDALNLGLKWMRYGTEEAEESAANPTEGSGGGSE